MTAGLELNPALGKRKFLRAAKMRGGVSAAHQRNDENDQQNQAERSATDPIDVSEHWCD